jgi:hypothetical protein
MLFPPFWLYPLFGSVSGHIGKSVRESQSGVINLAEVIPFEWDELFAYGPYSRREWICLELQLERESCHQTVPIYVDYDGGPYLLVFRKGGTIVYRGYHDMSDGAFTHPPHPIRREDSMYVVYEQLGRSYLRHIGWHDQP